jgi:hypothetical protein
LVGSGQFGTPWLRMHAANITIPFRICCHWAGFGPWPLLGSSWPQVFWAAGNWGLLSAICFELAGKLPLPLGSGQFGTPCERMQREKASSCWEDKADEFKCVEPDEFEDDSAARVVVDGPEATPGPEDPPHAAARTARAAMAMTAVAVLRAARRHPGGSRCMTGTPSCITVA